MLCSEQSGEMVMYVWFVQVVCGKCRRCSECIGLGWRTGVELPVGRASVLLHTQLQGLLLSQGHAYSGVM